MWGKSQFVSAMHIVLFGARGLIGRHLRASLLASGHTLTSISRFGDLPTLGSGETASTWRQLDTRGLPPCEAIIALMGKPILGARWNAKVKRALLKSRRDALLKIASFVRAMPHPPQHIIVASAVGIYPTTAKVSFDEETSLQAWNGDRPEGFLRTLCREWESAAIALEHFCPVTRLRLGAVLAPDGGILPRLLPWFRRGLGAQMGSGTQPFPWIHIRDLCEIIQLALAKALPGPLNCVAPDRVDQKTFARSLAQAVGARIHLRIPGLILRLGLGEQSQLLLEGSDVLSTRLPTHQFPFAFATLAKALADCCCNIHPNTPQRRLHMPKKSEKTEKNGKSDLPRLAADKHLNISFSTKKTLPLSQITAKFDCGFGHSLFIRGEGAQLNWERGIPLENIGPDLWRWQPRAPFQNCQFKLLLNDAQYEVGANRSLQCGDSVEITPEF